MDVDEDEDGTQPIKKVSDYGIEVDFESLDDDERQVSSAWWWPTFTQLIVPFKKDNTPNTTAEFDTSISKLNAEIERMAPNMKAIDRFVICVIEGTKLLNSTL